MIHASLIDLFYEAYDRRASDAVAALYQPEGWHEEVATGQRRVGRAAIAGGLEGFWRMLPDVAWARLGLVRAGDHIGVPYRMTATFARQGAAARPIQLDGLHLFELREGRIEGTRDMWDLDAFKAQMG